MSQDSPIHDPAFGAITREQIERIERGAWYHSIELPGGRTIPGLIPVEALRKRLDAYGIPQDLSGKRVLDIGAATGWCSFEMERRGAHVVATDCVEYEDFQVARRLIGSNVEYILMDVDEMTPSRLGVFDIVLFFGVLYHLRHPLLALEKVLSLASDVALMESFASDAHLPEPEWRSNECSVEFYETDELGGQIDNWVGPTVNCLLALCRSAGFARVELKYVENRRAGVLCSRHWEPEPEIADEPTPVLSSAVNNRTGDSVFHPGKDEYVCLYFRVGKNGVTRHDLRVEIDGAGVPVIALSKHEESGWQQANVRVPPDLGIGAHSVRLRLCGGRFGGARTITVGSPAARRERPVAKPCLRRACNGLSLSNEFLRRRNEYVRCCFGLQCSDLRREDVVIEIGGREVVPFFVGPDIDGAPVKTDQPDQKYWQANAKIPLDLGAGRYSVRVRTLAGESSNALELIFQ